MHSNYGLTYITLNIDNLDVAYHIQKETWPDDPDYNDLQDKVLHTRDNNCFFLVYDKAHIIGITGVDVHPNYPDTIWLDWFTILPQYRTKGYGKKVLRDIIGYCKQLHKYRFFRLETTYYENRPALFLYDKVMQTREYYTAEDTKDKKYNTLIYSYSLYGTLELWNNRYLGLQEYYKNCKESETNHNYDSNK